MSPVTTLLLEFFLHFDTGIECLGYAPKAGTSMAMTILIEGIIWPNQESTVQFTPDGVLTFLIHSLHSLGCAELVKHFLGPKDIKEYLHSTQESMQILGSLIRNQPQCTHTHTQPRFGVYSETYNLRENGIKMAIKNPNGHEISSNRLECVSAFEALVEPRPSTHIPGKVRIESLRWIFWNVRITMNYAYKILQRHHMLIAYRLNQINLTAYIGFLHLPASIVCPSQILCGNLR